MGELLQLQAESRSIKESGEANAQADEKMSLAEHERTVQINNMKLEHRDVMSGLRVHKQQNLTDIEAQKFEAIMGSLGQDTLVALARSGMESQLKMLEGLGLKGYLLTDGQTPINLFNAAD